MPEKCVVCDMSKKGIHRRDDELSKLVDRKQRCDAWTVVYGINCTRCTQDGLCGRDWPYTERQTKRTRDGC